MRRKPVRLAENQLNSVLSCERAEVIVKAVGFVMVDAIRAADYKNKTKTLDTRLHPTLIGTKKTPCRSIRGSCASKNVVFLYDREKRQLGRVDVCRSNL